MTAEKQIRQYDHYPCAHSICGAHLVRDCIQVYEQEQQPWTEEMADLRLSMAEAANAWHKLGAHAAPAKARNAWIAQYARAVGLQLRDMATAVSKEARNRDDDN